jgi:hypothetical protein
MRASDGFFQQPPRRRGQRREGEEGGTMNMALRIHKSTIQLRRTLGIAPRQTGGARQSGQTRALFVCVCVCRCSSSSASQMPSARPRRRCSSTPTHSPILGHAPRAARAFCRARVVSTLSRDRSVVGHLRRRRRDRTTRQLPLGGMVGWFYILHLPTHPQTRCEANCPAARYRRDGRSGE